MDKVVLIMAGGSGTRFWPLSTNERIIKKELPEIPEKNIIFEPMARDTAACIGYAALIIQKIYKDSIMAVLPSDHLIKKE